MQPARHRMGRDWAAKGRTVADSVKKKKKKKKVLPAAKTTVGIEITTKNNKLNYTNLE